MQSTLDIEALLGDPVPDDWNDLAAVEARQDHLAEIASAAGEATVELLVRAKDLQQHGLTLSSGDPFVLAWAAALDRMHCAIFRYNHDVPQSGNDGLKRALRAIEKDTGAGIATLVTRLLKGLWDDLDRLSRERIMARTADLDWENVNARRCRRFPVR